MTVLFADPGNHFADPKGSADLSLRTYDLEYRYKNNAIRFDISLATS